MDQNRACLCECPLLLWCFYNFSFAPPTTSNLHLETLPRLPRLGFMRTQRWRPLYLATAAVLLIWVVAVAGYRIARNARVTADKIKAYAETVDLKTLRPEERAEAIERLAAMLNKLDPEERRKARLERTAWDWFAQMTESEKEHFIDETMPTGFKQMITSFEQMPADQRRRAVDSAVRRLRSAQGRLDAEQGGSAGTNGPPVISEELQAKIRTIGLRTFYSQSSPETKAELAPVLEELQQVMQSGRHFGPR